MTETESHSSEETIATSRVGRSRFREMIGSALFEAAFVVFGVVIAYLVNEWREDRLHRQDAAAARAAILSEFRENRKAAKASADYHNMLIDSLISRGRARIPSDIRLFSRGFYLPASLGSTAWEVAEQTGALNYMPFEEVLRCRWKPPCGVRRRLPRMKSVCTIARSSVAGACRRHRASRSEGHRQPRKIRRAVAAE